MDLPRGRGAACNPNRLRPARLFLESGEHPGRLKDRVASPAGTTMAGLHKLGTGKAESRSDVGGRRSRQTFAGTWGARIA